MSYRPYPFGGNALTGDVRSYPSLAVFLSGKWPWKLLHCGRSSANGSSPQTYFFPASPPRAANSHSASVGSRLPAHWAYATASSQETWTTGWSSRPSRLLPGPSGRVQQASGWNRHQRAALLSGTFPAGGAKTIDAGTSSSAGG